MKLDRNIDGNCGRGKYFDALWPYELSRGNSDHPRHGACTMDAVSWFAYGQLGDHPPCACPILTEFVIYGQDAMPDAIRQRLKPYIFRLLGSRDPGAEPVRLRCLVLAATRVFAPMALDAAGLMTEARKLRDLPDGATVGQMRSAAAAAAAAAWAEAARAVEAVEAAAARAAWAAADGATEAAKSAARVAVEVAAARAAARAAQTAAAAWTVSGAVWDAYFETLDEALSLGRQGSLDIDLVPPRLAEFAAARRSQTATVVPGAVDG